VSPASDRQSSRLDALRQMAKTFAGGWGFAGGRIVLSSKKEPKNFYPLVTSLLQQFYLNG
jgi:hypothetical protein